MASSLTPVLKATVGLPGSKGLPRHKTGRKRDELKLEGLTHHRCCLFLVRKLGNIKSKVDRSARKDLLASISFLKQGIVSLQQVLAKTKRTGKDDLKCFRSEADFSDVASLVTEMNNLQLRSLDELAKKALSDAKRRFGDAREKATEAFSNEGLNSSDRVLAMVIRVMGTVLGSVENPANALEACSVCLEELHALPAVQKCFEAKRIKHFKFWSKKDGRKQITATVYQLNRFMYDVMHLVGSAGNDGTLFWPYFVPVRDPGVTPQINLELTLCLK